MSTWRRLWKDEVRGTPPFYRILVPDSVPESVVRVWNARGYKVSAGAPTAPFLHPAMNRNLIRSNIGFQAARTTSVAAVAAAGLPTGIEWIASSTLSGVGAAITGVLAVGGTALTGWTGWKFRKDPKRLDREQKEAAAKARWITPSDLGFIPGEGGLLRGTGGQDTDEQRLFHLAVVTARKITQTRAWTHPILQDHVSRVDLDHAVGSIGVRLQELVSLRAELESVREPHTSARIDAYLGKLGAAFSSMSARVVAMHEYYEHLLDLDRQLQMLEHTERSKELGDRVLDVLSRTADDETADWRFRELNIEADSHSDVIRGLLDDLIETAGEFDDLDDLDRRLAQAQTAAPQGRAREDAPERRTQMSPSAQEPAALEGIRSDAEETLDRILGADRERKPEDRGR